MDDPFVFLSQSEFEDEAPWLALFQSNPASQLQENSIG
jgi:hypothetical protein